MVCPFSRLLRFSRKRAAYGRYWDHWHEGDVQLLGIPLANWVEAVRCLKEEAIALLGDEDAAEVTPYFDHIIRTLAYPGAPYFMNDGTRDY